MNINTTDIFAIPEGTNTDAELESVINKAHSLGMKVMLKLHIDNIVQFGGMWRGDIGMYFTPEKWNVWFANYQEFAKHYAALAQRLGVEQMAIGTELIASDLQDKHWREVVSVVRKEYKGTLTYACNFWGDNVYGARFSCSNVTWWDVLDTIGVDAYFPLAPETPEPSYEQLQKSWIPISRRLEELSKKYGKPLIFTEIGYTSQRGANIAPNKWDAAKPTNYTIQAECYRAFFEEMAVKNSDWFKGVFWWAWWTDPLSGLDYTNLYTPQNKPAVLSVLKEYYGTGTAENLVHNVLLAKQEKSDPFWCGVPQG
eukprot:TRINITY_DN1466_c0_g1_i1.p1 TRINITY_DN1466_c0_g1~~TRINITY_DN1466_c0_g1_i1.p1  ORF type:complete len:312 (+),score=49.67 TRINITY_DN1466_c0_g1_i1:212-1147(+)